MKNPLMVDVYVNNLKLYCLYEGESLPSESLHPIEQSLVLKPLETKEVVLQVIPKKKGTLLL